MTTKDIKKGIELGLNNIEDLKYIKNEEFNSFINYISMAYSKIPKKEYFAIYKEVIAIYGDISKENIDNYMERG